MIASAACIALCDCYSIHEKRRGKRSLPSSMPSTDQQCPNTTMRGAAHMVSLLPFSKPCECICIFKKCGRMWNIPTSQTGHDQNFCLNMLCCQIAHMTRLLADRAGSVRTEQLKLLGPSMPSMTSFVQTMQSALQQRAWERSLPAETSGHTHTDSNHASDTSSSLNEQLVDSAVVNQMVAMGFAKDGASLAAMKTGNTGTASCSLITQTCRTHSSVTCSRLQMQGL